MIGAKDAADALKEARWSTEKPDTESLETWCDGSYKKVASAH